MKKFYIIAIMALCTAAANAQQKLNLSTYTGTNLERYDGKECNVTVSRYVLTGWNTLSLPFALSADELDEIFGADCRLERLAGVETLGAGLQLNFLDCKAEGLQPNTPYILYYAGQPTSKRIQKQANIVNATSELSFTASNGVTVTMKGVAHQTDARGLYGILARDNSEARFVNVDDVANGFFATRCYVTLSNGNATQLTSRHIKATDATSINTIATAGEQVDVYNVAGVKVAANVRAAEVNALPAGIYVVKGRKIMVK